MNHVNAELAQACADWQGGRDTGSTPIRGAARVLTGLPHYFQAQFITEQEQAAQANPIVRQSAQLLLDAVNAAPLRTVDERNESVGMPLRGFAGRGLEPKPPYDDQILSALGTGTLAMPLWGVSLSRYAAWWFGTAGNHTKPRFIFTIDGPFPAIPSRVLSGEKADEEELICGGEYSVIDVVDDPGSNSAI